MFENETTEDLKARVQAMSLYYQKGFGGVLWNVYVFVEIFEKKRREQHKIGAYSEYWKISSLYARIPFDDLKSPDFSPLFEVRDMLPRFKTTLDSALGTPSPEFTSGVLTIVKEMADHGRPYHDNMIKMLHHVQTEREERDFHVDLMDDLGIAWRF